MGAAHDLAVRAYERTYDAIRETALSPEPPAHFEESRGRRMDTIRRAMAIIPTGDRVREIGPAKFGEEMVRGLRIHVEAYDCVPWCRPVYIVYQARWKAPTGPA